MISFGHEPTTSSSPSPCAFPLFYICLVWPHGVGVNDCGSQVCQKLVHHPVLVLELCRLLKVPLIPWIICSVVAISLDSDLLRDVHAASLELRRSATMHEGDARREGTDSWFLFSCRSEGTMQPTVSAQTATERETKSRCKNNLQKKTSLLSSARVSSWTESGPIPFSNSKLVRLTRRMSASTAADGLMRPAPALCRIPRAALES